MYPSFAHLKGRRVLVTRGQGQAWREVAALEGAGAIPIHIPLIEICAPSDGYAALDSAIAGIDLYAWIAFTSANGVVAFFSRLEGRSVPSGAKLAAVGPATATAIEESGAKVAVVPREHSSSGLLEEMLRLVRKGDRVLFPRALEGRELLADGLRAKGARVDVVEAYRTTLPADAGRLTLLIAERGIDAAIFASPSAVENFVQIVGTERARGFAKNAELIPIGEVTAETIKRLLIPPRPV
ncbi:MAG: uroporphyrinogen-III synthase [Pseudomonadota bacterium]